MHVNIVIVDADVIILIFTAFYFILRHHVMYKCYILKYNILQASRELFFPSQPVQDQANVGINSVI